MTYRPVTDDQPDFLWRCYPPEPDDEEHPYVEQIPEELRRAYPNRVMVEHSCERCAQGFSSIKARPRFCSNACRLRTMGPVLGEMARELNTDTAFRARFMAARAAAGYPDKNRPEAVARRKLRAAAKNAVKRCLARTGAKKDASVIVLVGYSPEQARRHIETLFLPGMTWANYGRWEIDHKRPIASFDPGTPLSVVNALVNLQPLWKADNRRKSNRVSP